MRPPAAARFLLPVRWLPIMCALLGVALAACAPGPALGANVAALVNGEEIPLSDVEDRFEAAKQNPQLGEQLKSDAEGTLKGRVQADILSQLITSKLLEQGAGDLGVTVSDEDIEAQRQQVVEEVGGEEAFDQVVSQYGLTDEQVEGQLRELALQEQVESKLSKDVEIADAEVRQLYEEQRASRYESARARHILVETEQEAQQVKQRIAAGEDFAVLAKELSKDTGSAQKGGDLGEFTRGQMVPAFEEAVFNAEAGQVVGPVESQFGYHIIEVLERSDVPFAEVEEDLREELAQTRQAEAVQSWLGEQKKAADIKVNPRFGSWDGEEGKVVPDEPLDASTESGDGQPPTSPASG